MTSAVPNLIISCSRFSSGSAASQRLNHTHSVYNICMVCKRQAWQLTEPVWDRLVLWSYTSLRAGPHHADMLLAQGIPVCPTCLEHHLPQKRPWLIPSPSSGLRHATTPFSTGQTFSDDYIKLQMFHTFFSSKACHHPVVHWTNLQ